MRQVIPSLVILAVTVFAGDAGAFFGGGKDGDVLKKSERAAAEKSLAELESEVQLVFFDTPGKCKECGRITRLVSELSSFSEQISYELLDFKDDSDRAAALNLERAPALVLLGKEGRDYGIRYYGLPLGFEFEAFLGAIISVASGAPALEPETVTGLEALKEPVRITVFVARH